MNKVILIGNLAKAPELSTTPNGISVCQFSLAVSRKFKDDNAVDFFNVVAWRGLAENCNKFLSKGKKAAVIGSLQTRSYDDKNGNKRYITEIVADDVEFLSPVEKDDPIPDKKQSVKQAKMEVIDDDDLPF